MNRLSPDRILRPVAALWTAGGRPTAAALAAEQRRHVLTKTEESMTKHLITGLAIVIVVGLVATPTGQAQSFKVEKYDIKGDGGTDYIAVESATGRAFVSRGTHMMVVDASGKV